MKKINVLQFICPTGFYGAERWILALANNLDTDSVQCYLAVTHESKKQNLEIVDQFIAGGGNAFKIRMSHRFDLRALTELCRLIRENNIDVIHTHGYKSDVLGILAAKRTGIRSVSTPHGFGEAKDFKLKAFIRLGCFSLKFFDKISPLSKQLYDEVLRYGVPTRKVTYIQNGVDLKEVDKFRDVELRAKQENEPNRNIGFIGQMIPRKKINHILDIFDTLWANYPDLKLQLLGDGHSRRELEDYARTLPSHANIEFLGFRNDRLKKLNDFDLFVMTSSSEGIPRCLMEAMAMEVPVAAYDIPGIDLLLDHGKTGLLAKFCDTSTLATYWEKLLFNEPYSRQIAAQGRKFVLDNFSAQRMAQEYTTMYNEITGPQT